MEIIENTSNRRKQYTFMNIHRALRSDGSEYVACTVAARVTNVTALQRTPDGTPVIDFIIPIENRSVLIGKLCGLEPSTDEYGTTWADVSVWGDAAENFAAYVEKHPRSVITLTGSIRVEEVVSKAGVPYNRVKIRMANFDHKTDLPPRKEPDEPTIDPDSLAA